MVKVNVDNFRAAETAQMLDKQLSMTGGVNQWFHFRVPTPVDQQPVIRMNRDTLYSGAVVDISGGGTITMPEVGDRYQTVMVINQEHYINRVFNEPGTHELTIEEHGSPFVDVVARTFVNANDPDDIAEVNRLQDGLVLDMGSANPLTHPEYDPESLISTRELLKTLGKGIGDTGRTFGAASDVEPTRHLIGTADAWGGLPEAEAYYIIESEPRELGRYTFTLGDIPVDAFWSVTIYNKDGYLEPNPFDSYNLNSITAQADSDGSVTLNLAPEGDGLINHLYVMDGWNHALRLYKPRPEVIDKTWTPPRPQPVD
jgi:hypothetical protein